MIEVQLSPRSSGGSSASAGRARLVLAPDATSTWRWEEDGAVLVMPHGGTIAFRDEVATVLAGFEHAPDFGALALLLAACSSEWPQLRDGRLKERVYGLKHSEHSLDAAEVLAGLEHVHELPSELRTSPEARARLATLVLEPDARSDPPDDLLAALERGGAWARDILRWPDDPVARPLERFVRSLGALEKGLRQVDETRLRRLAETGLEEGVSPVADETVLPADVRDLLEELATGDSRVAAVARVARRVLAALRLPRRLADEEDLEVGGASDLTNRGPLHRLLVSELAHDPDVLAARVALGEALYLRREPPREPRRRHRAILIDTGVRMWGLPRVFAAGVALALAAGDPEVAGVSCARTGNEESGAAFTPVRLQNADGVNGLLAALHPEPSPELALREFVGAMLPAVEAEHLELVLITHPDALLDPALATLLADPTQLGLRRGSLLTAAVDARGRMDVEAILPRRQHLVHAELELDELLEQGTARRLEPGEAEVDLPAILFFEPFPLLLAHDIRLPRTAFHPHHGVVAVTKDSRLLHWRPLDQGEVREGALQLSQTISPGHLWLLDIGPDGVVRVVTGGQQAGHLVLATCDLETREFSSRQIAWSDESPSAVTLHRGMLYVQWRHTLEALEPDTGASLAKRQDAGGWRHLGDSFFSTPEAAIATPTVRGGTIELIPETWGSREGIGLGRILDTVRTSDGHGFVHLQTAKDKQLRHTTSGQRISMRSSMRRPEILARNFERTRLFIRGDYGTRVDLATGETHVVTSDLHANLHWLEPQLARRTQFISSVRKSFRAIGLTPDGTELVLISRKDIPQSIVLDGEEMRFVQGSGKVEAQLEFESIPTPRGGGYELRKAEWRNGSRAFLDSRGLLHLRSADGTVPDLTLVLGDYSLAGWSSEGIVCGHDYFIAEALRLGCRRVEPSVFFISLRHFLRGIE